MIELKDKELHFFSQLSGYSLKSILIRVAWASGVGLLFFFLSIKIAGDVNLHVSVLEYVQVVLIFNIISESNVFVDQLAERFLPIPEKIKLRVVLHLIVSLIIAIAAVFYFSLIVRDVPFFSHPIVQLMMFLGLIFIFILILISITLRIVEKWVFSVRQLEVLKSQKLKSDYNSLQAQLNPHFLFNNLSVLKSLITFDPDAAIHFTQNFTDVYRYVLQSKDQTTVKLSDELEFIEAYIALHKKRMGEAFEVIINVSESALKKDVPPLALQLLVENAVKHNIAVKDAPLSIRIESTENKLTVSNNLNLKESAFSEKTGLNNLKQRYALLTDSLVEVSHGSETFEVKIPLL